MDQLNLNMRQHRWLDVVKYYDCEGKSNVVTDALSRKATGAHIRGLCLRKTIISPLLDLTWEAHTEVIKRENWKKENIRG